MPEEYLGQFYNACTDPCDMLQGPCACGAWHHQEEWPDEIQTEIFGFVSDKETIIKRKPKDTPMIVNGMNVLKKDI